MLDVTETLEDRRRAAYEATLRDTLASVDWIGIELASSSELRFGVGQCLNWLTEDLDWLVWATGRNEGYSEPLCTWDA